ncbi:hypothetical protein NQ176_g4780 [Zarea fungicola]|uniref:Uncharacterized protein n=1 Tax=Zarea fungicola TaxID=93591 RepID=A0ACC1NCM3_9HYPO|nr:hypothetical protein NQ176_g4780 [Lecanicillium fungicola]
MKFKTIARRWHRITQQATNVPYAFVQDRMKEGAYQPCYVSKHVQQVTKDDTMKMDPGAEDAIKWTASVMYAGGADTTVSVISGFVLAMVMFPEVQKKAQKEIDTVIGSSRLPELQDQGQLPYISAVVKEALRWFPIAPMGTPHAADDDIHYKEYIIPKGSLILTATWWFQNDPQVYVNPSAFEPERFIAPRNEPDPIETVFGSGRRICPGKYLADMSLFWTISRILAVFDIRQAVDESGMPIEATRHLQPGLITHPEEFPFNIVVRSPAHAKLVENIEKSLPLQSGDDKLLNFQGW